MTIPAGGCPIGSLGLHTMNYEDTECIWCGPGRLAWREGKWIDIGGGYSAWSAVPEITTPLPESDLRPACPDCGAPLDVNVPGFEPLEVCTNARCGYRI